MTKNLSFGFDKKKTSKTITENSVGNSRVAKKPVNLVKIEEENREVTSALNPFIFRNTLENSRIHS